MTPRTIEKVRTCCLRRCISAAEVGVRGLDLMRGLDGDDRGPGARLIPAALLASDESSSSSSRSKSGVGTEAGGGDVR